MSKEVLVSVERGLYCVKIPGRRESVWLKPSRGKATEKGAIEAAKAAVRMLRKKKRGKKRNTAPWWPGQPTAGKTRPCPRCKKQFKGPATRVGAHGYVCADCYVELRGWEKERKKNSTAPRRKGEHLPGCRCIRCDFGPYDPKCDHCGARLLTKEARRGRCAKCSRKNPTHAARDFISKEIRHLVRDKGYEQRRAVAAAHSIARRKGFRSVPDKSNPLREPKVVPNPLTKKDFEAGARIVRRQALPCREPLVADLEDWFAGENVRFDRERFRAAAFGGERNLFENPSSCRRCRGAGEVQLGPRRVPCPLCRRRGGR